MKGLLAMHGAVLSLAILSGAFAFMLHEYTCNQLSNNNVSNNTISKIFTERDLRKIVTIIHEPTHQP